MGGFIDGNYVIVCTFARNNAKKIENFYTMKSQEIISIIKKTVNKSDPEAKVILFGSYAKGDQNENSDIDVLILLNQQKITTPDEKRIKYPLYDIEFDTGKIISPVVMSITDWHTKHKITPFYHNVELDGKLI